MVRAMVHLNAPTNLWHLTIYIALRHEFPASRWVAEMPSQPPLPNITVLYNICNICTRGACLSVLGRVYAHSFLDVGSRNPKHVGQWVVSEKRSSRWT